MKMEQKIEDSSDNITKYSESGVSGAQPSTEASGAVDSIGSFQVLSLNDDRGTLTDDADQAIDFRRTKLKVNPAELSVGDADDFDYSINENDGDDAVKNFEVTISPVGLTRDRPFGASTLSRASRASTKSKVSLSSHIKTSDDQAKNLFCYRTDAIEKAVDDCKARVIVRTIDGEMKGYWLLTEIDHWDLEKERLIILCEHSLLVIKYDFIALRPNSCRRIQLSVISYVEVGDFVYPRYSIMPSRDHGGLRIHWGNSPASMSQMWNPLCDDVGFMTFTHHLLAYNEKEKETVTFDVADLIDSLVQAVGEARGSERRMEALRVENRPITIVSYANAAALVFNQSHIGFHMERGGVSF